MQLKAFYFLLSVFWCVCGGMCYIILAFWKYCFGCSVENGVGVKVHPSNCRETVRRILQSLRNDSQLGPGWTREKWCIGYGASIEERTPSSLTSITEWMMVQDQVGGEAGREGENHEFSVNSLWNVQEEISGMWLDVTDLELEKHSGTEIEIWVVSLKLVIEVMSITFITWKKSDVWEEWFWI